MVRKKFFKWKIWSKKLALVAAGGAVIALMGYVESIPIEPSQAIYVTLGMMFLRGAHNLIKHSNKLQ